MTSTPATSLAPSPAEPLSHQVLAALAQHRIATTSQLRRMLRPDGTRQLLSRVLNKLRSDSFVDCTVLPDANRSRTHAWYLTQEGSRLTRDLPVLRGRPPYPITSDTAASLKTPHTLAVVRAHLAFAADARRLGHEHGPWDWTPEGLTPSAKANRLRPTPSCTTPPPKANTDESSARSRKPIAPP